MTNGTQNQDKAPRGRLIETEQEYVGRVLASGPFQIELQNLLEHWAEKPGSLYLLRNRIPRALIAERAMYHDGVSLHYGEDEIADFFRGLRERARLLKRHADRLTVVVPASAPHYFFSEKALLLPRAETPTSGELAADRIELAWKAFLADWGACTRWFEPRRRRLPGTPEVCELDSRAGKIAGVPADCAYVNTLPDLWIYLAPRTDAQKSSSASDQSHVGRLIEEALSIARKVDSPGEGRAAHSTRASLSPEHTSRLQDMLDEKELVVIKITAAEYTSRFCGALIHEAQHAWRFLLHAGVSLLWSSGETPSWATSA